ncbi:unnamed protein product [Macrosiphum euphorbiae]|uniref:Uncharacterized protein n=1 Tax=Macrosiphum euphorbiae TaxID=13131 RepID=A0AAV0WGD7_9HEMI|nr:unnamed protein product [Macrosiphum euphorbiae]
MPVDRRHGTLMRQDSVRRYIEHEKRGTRRKRSGELRYLHAESQKEFRFRQLSSGSRFGKIIVTLGDGDSSKNEKNANTFRRAKINKQSRPTTKTQQ